MLITVDRLQFNNEQLMCFEFFDIKRDLKHIEYVKAKIQLLNNDKFCDKFYLVQYDISNLNNVYIGQGINKKKYNFSSFRNWFTSLNNTANTENAHSKALGNIISSKGDNYVKSLLNAIYQDDTQYKGMDFLTDDNGLEIVTKTLADQSTYGFDFDLYESESRTVIEFLKRENNFVTNLTAHPSRYPANKKKFISLWNAAKRLNPVSPNFYCINYSDNDEEAIGVIQILDFDTSNNNKMVTSDIGYKLEDKNSLIHWLTLLHNDHKAAYKYLQQKPMEIRNHHFFDEVYNNNKKYLIGKNYS